MILSGPLAVDGSEVDGEIGMLQGHGLVAKHLLLLDPLEYKTTLKLHQSITEIA